MKPFSAVELFCDCFHYFEALVLSEDIICVLMGEWKNRTSWAHCHYFETIHWTLTDVEVSKSFYLPLHLCVIWVLGLNIVCDLMQKWKKWDFLGTHLHYFEVIHGTLTYIEISLRAINTQCRFVSLGLLVKTLWGI